MGKLLKGYVRSVARFTGARHAQKVVENVVGRVLLLAVPKGVSTAAQRQVIREVTRYAADRGVTLVLRLIR